jgi:hypothetical protein
VYLTGHITQGCVYYEHASLASLSLGHMFHRRAFCGRASHGRVPGVHLTGVYLMGVHLTEVHLMGVHLTGMHLTCVRVGRRSSSHVCHINCVRARSAHFRKCICDFVIGTFCPNDPPYQRASTSAALIFCCPPSHSREK